ncbi:hypothetical protein Afil01_11350 [Actinorhabdospora filicis]|uniref:NACHT domain-containing protein n=1 Tax=Actinorhabdospora filicis TaxID=1785913 RepID=A0A9W6W7V8_9ACTN|nr:trypsin-like peptidase domain-containing protein [Actinorhabdospora filicis]GLZ76328.1 hypothetical protein Afil01_11350 [Actinorhabdospora filicis]
MTEHPVHGVARVSTGDGRAAGLAFQHAPGRFATCAHVVNSALGRDRRDPGVPEGILGLRLFDGTELRALVAAWGPGRKWADRDDTAVLAALDPVPAAIPVLAAMAAPEAMDVRVCGPSPDRDGTALDHVRGRLAGERSPGLWQLHQETDGPFRVRGGYSGGPVWTDDGRVVGLVRAARAGRSDAECLALDRLPRTARDVGGAHVLHVHGLRLDGAARASALLASVAARALAHGVRPDAVVFSGNLAASARPTEYALVAALIADLRALFGLGPERIVTVPGPSDVSAKACGAYFMDCEDAETAPVWPYARKWSRYATVDPLPQGTPWRWVELTDPPLVVAGLNSTVHDTHLLREPGFGTEQTDWFHARLGTVGTTAHRLGVAAEFPAHDAAGDLDLDVRLSGEGFGYELHVLHGRELKTLRCPHDGTGFAMAEPETIGLPAREAVITRPPKPAPDEMDRVQRALEFREPGARLIVHRDHRYIHVVTTHDFGGGAVPTGGYAVGVRTGRVYESDVDAFATGVLERLRATDDLLQAQLVYFGPLPDPRVSEYARRHRVSLISFRQFQFSWDPRAFVRWQTARLAADRRYPADLYIPQRYRRVSSSGTFDDGYGDPAPEENLHRQILSWLGDDAARLVVVLGSAGAGKTFLLRTLAERLSADDGPLTPVYLQLRELERVPNLDVYVAGRFADAQEHRIDMGRFNYYLEQGHIALLLDGLDELTVHGGYDRAVGHLSAISEKVKGKAKVVITARDTEFLSNREVLKALGGNSAALSGRRALHVEDFADDQVEEFLTRFLGSPAAARERLALLGSVGPLPEVARNPRMLSFLALLEPDRLRRAADDSGGEINSAELYRALLNQWMDREAERLRRPGEKPALTTEELWAAVTKLAVYLWTTERESIAVEDLGAAADLLSHVDADARIRQVGSGSVLIRHEDGDLGFIHRSVQEWLVAKSMVADPGLLGRRTLSGQAARFYRELGGTVTGSSSGEVEGRNIALIGDSEGLYFGDTDARGHDFSADTLIGATYRNSTLADADLAGHDLTGTKFLSSDLTGVNLSGAKLERTRFDGSALDFVSLLGTEVTLAQLADAASLFGTALPGEPVSVQYKPCHLSGFHVPSPTSTLVATCDPVGWVRITDLASGRLLKQWRECDTVIAVLRWSPEGTLLAIGIGDVLRARDVVSERVLWEVVLPSDILAVTWSSDGEIAVTTAEGRLYFINDGVSRLSRLAVTSGPMAFSPDGILLAGPFVSDPLPMLPLSATAVAWSPDGSRLAYGDAHGRLRCRTPSGESEVTLPSAHTTGITSLDWSGDGERILAADGFGYLSETYVDDVERRTPAITHKGTEASYVLDGTCLLLGPGELRMVDLADGSLREPFAPSSAAVTGAAWSPSGDRIASVHGRDRLTAWSVESSTALWSQQASWADWDRSGDRIAVERGGFIRYVQARSGQPTDARLEVSGAAAGHSPSGDLLAIWNARGLVVRPVDLPEENTRWDITGIRDARWLSEELLLAVGQDGTIRRLPLRNGDIRVVPGSGHHLPVFAILDDGTVLRALADGAIEIFDLDRDASVATFDLHDRPVFAIDVARHTGLVASADDSGLVKTWRAGPVIDSWTAHDGPVTTMSFSPDGTKLLTGGQDGLLRIWTPQGEHVTTLISLEVGSAAVHGDGLTFQLDGDLRGEFWYSAALARLDPVTLARHTAEVTRLPRATPQMDDQQS